MCVCVVFRGGVFVINTCLLLQPSHSLFFLQPHSSRPHYTSMDDKCSPRKAGKIQSSCTSQEVSSIEWEFIDMSEQEEDIIDRMHKLVGDKWGLIAGRVPGRKAEEIERYWLMRTSESFKDKRKQQLQHKGSLHS